MSRWPTVVGVLVLAALLTTAVLLGLMLAGVL